MNVLPVFISYRQDDGAEWAQSLYRSLHGHTIEVRHGSLVHWETISVYLDKETPVVPNWQDHLRGALEVARALVVICTPAVKHQKESQDWFYYEISWWLEHRSTLAPILLTPYGPSWIPDVIHARWPDVQFLDVSRRPPKLATSGITMGLGRIVRSISLSAGEYSAIQPAENPPNDEAMLSQPGYYSWEKDRNFRYVNCNDNYARAAGYDSARAMIGKTDDDMPWRPWANYFRMGDQQVISGLGPMRFNFPETEMMVDRVADILVTERQLQLRGGECVGLTGYFYDITGFALVPKDMARVENGKGLCLGNAFGNECLSETEVEVFKRLLQQQSRQAIADSLNLSAAVVDWHVKSIKQKLQCVTDGDVIATAIRSGLPLALFGPEGFLPIDIPTLE